MCMLTLLLISMAIVLAFVAVIVILGAGGAAIMIVFGDLIVAIGLIVLLIKFIRRKKK